MRGALHYEVTTIVLRKSEMRQILSETSPMKKGTLICLCYGETKPHDVIMARDISRFMTLNADY